MNNDNLEFANAVYLLPEVPSIDVLRFLSAAAYGVPTHVKDRGDNLQRRYGLDAIPPVAEMQWAAGLWSVIRDALIAENSRKNQLDDVPG